MTGTNVHSRDDRDDRYAEVFAALGHPARLAILRHLLRAHPTGLVVGDIQSRLGIPGSTLTHHLEAMRRAEIVETEREAQRIRYRASVPGLRDIIGFLCTECCAETRVVPVAAIRSSLKS